MLTAEACSRLAEECEPDAGRAASAKVREELLETARMWRDLADFKTRRRRSHSAGTGPSRTVARD
jgi:hypothetical protein